VIALIAAFIALAIAKPWSADAPSPSPAPSLVGLASPPGSTPVASSADGSSVAGVAPVMPIVLEVPPGPNVAWTGIGWRRLVPGDPLAALRLVRSTSSGYLAVGTDPADDPATLVWTSPDGATWTPVPSGTGTTFWPGSVAVGAGAAATRMVVLTGLRPAIGCGADGLCSYLPGVVAWASADGASWAPNPLPSIIAAGPRPGRISVASGPRGLVAAWAASEASGTASTRLATSVDGTTWAALPTSALPAGTFVTDLVASPGGYLAVGWTTSGAGSSGSIVLRSTDGRTWRRADPAGSARLVVSLAAGAGGFVAMASDPGTGETARWWRSADGASWTLVSGHPPLGPAACPDGCRDPQDGSLLGDATRLVALQGGPDGVAWTSSDGATWRPVRMTGDLPSASGLGVALLPGGVLVSDGSTSWYGAATGS
jgi:hypothetical protein